MAQKVIIAEGIEIRDYQGAALIAYLNAAGDAHAGSVWTYPKGASGAAVKYEVKLVYTMAELAAALDTPDIYVIYEGHSRYGQGPAFGPAGIGHVPPRSSYPINPWGVHYRMGWDATDTEAVGDLLEHSVTPAEYALPASADAAFLPRALTTARTRIKTAEERIRTTGAPRCTAKGAWRMFSSCQAALAATTTARSDRPLLTRHYYAHQVGKRRREGLPPPEDEFLVAVTVGSANLDVSMLRCKLLFIASCSSRVHFYAALNRRRRAIRSKCKFYLTNRVSWACNARNFIRQLFRGIDPLSRAGSKRVVKRLNRYRGSGIVGFY